MKKIAFGRTSDWHLHLQNTIDHEQYQAISADFTTFDLGEADAAVPLTLEDAAALRQRYGDQHPKYLIPGANVMALCADKLRFNEHVLLTEYHWMIPQVLTEAERQFPYLLKKRHSLSGVDIFPIRDAADAADHAAKLASDEYFCQQYIPGRLEYATHMLMVNGRGVHHSSNCYEMAGNFAIKGNAQKPVHEQYGIPLDDQIIEDFIGLLNGLGFNGICSIDYKLIDGKIRLLELNPRAGFTLFRDINAFLYPYLSALE